MSIEALTDRERAVLQLVAQGKANHAIAVELGLRPPTVKGYLASIYRKLGVANRVAAAVVWDRSQR